MRSTFKVEKPDTIELTMTITMSLKDWKQLSKDLQNTYPSWTLSGEINSMVHQASRNYVPEAPEETKE